MDNFNLIKLNLMNHEIKILYIFWIIIYILNNSIISMMPEKYCKNIYIKYFYIFLFLILLGIDVFELRYLMNTKPLSENIPNYLWMLVLLISIFIIHKNINNKTIEKDGTLNIPPNNIKNKRKRLKRILLVIFVFMVVSIINYIINNNRNMRVGTIVIYFIFLYSIINYRACNFNFPISWNL